MGRNSAHQPCAKRMSRPARADGLLPGAMHNAAMDARPGGSDAAASKERLAALRSELKSRGLAGFIIPVQDEHQAEWVPGHARRLEWLTGFRGSAGLAIALADKAALFVDGRYTLQVRSQTDTDLFATRHLIDEPASDWIEEHLGQGTLGYDPRLHTLHDVESFGAACKKAGGSLEVCDTNPVDAVWRDRPAAPRTPMLPHAREFAGESAADKRERVAKDLKKAKVDAAVLTFPDSIAWLLNVRGGDLEFSPVTLCYAVLNADATVDLFVDPQKVSGETAAHLGNAVTLAPADAFGPALDRLGAAKARVLIDPATASASVFQRLEAAGAQVERGADPCVLPKACKNDVELEGMRAAHVRDGTALTRFLAWLPGAVKAGALDEIAAAEKLYELRAAGQHFQRLSFPTIAGSGPNGAIVHYRATGDSNRRLGTGDLFLLDSGAQYLDGTTDVTRTIAIGASRAEERDRFTRVLKGHIALATCRFPEGTAGSQLDTLARKALWDAGLDFDHGTGHGVGSYLNVHEGPQRISKIPNRQALLPGMIVSNEPGYYKTDAYGIRIENLLAVRKAKKVRGAERTLLEFETLTLAPIDRTLLDHALLDVEEIAWLDAYHERVRETLTPHLDADTTAWLERATAPVGA